MCACTQPLACSDRFLYFSLRLLNGTSLLNVHDWAMTTLSLQKHKLKIILSVISNSARTKRQLAIQEHFTLFFFCHFRLNGNFERWLVKWADSISNLKISVKRCQNPKEFPSRVYQACHILSVDNNSTFVLCSQVCRELYCLYWNKNDTAALITFFWI